MFFQKQKVAHAMEIKSIRKEKEGKKELRIFPSSLFFLPPELRAGQTFWLVGYSGFDRLAEGGGAGAEGSSVVGAHLTGGEKSIMGQVENVLKCQLKVNKSEVTAKFLSLKVRSI